MSGCISNLRFLKVFYRFGVQNGSRIEENLVKMARLSPSWDVLGDLGLQVGLSLEMLEARWSQGSDQKRQDEPPEAPRREGCTPMRW